MLQPLPLPRPLRIARIFQFVFIFGYLIFTIFNITISSKENRFKLLESIAIDSQDNLYIAQAGNSTIVKYDAQGKTLLTWGSAGSGDGQFGASIGLGKLAIGPHDDLYVLDKTNYRVQKFDQKGNFLAKWG